MNFFGCWVCLIGIISCSSIVFVDDGDIDDDDLRICWCCWASNAAWWGLETIAINAPVVGSRNGGVAADDVFDNVKGLYAEPNERLVKSWPFIPDENKLDRWCFDDWASKIRLGGNLLVGEPL